MFNINVLFTVISSYIVKYSKFFFSIFIIGILVLPLVVCKFVEVGASEDASLFISAKPLNIKIGGTSRIKVGGFNADGSLLKNGTVIQLYTDFGSVDNKLVISNGVAYGTLKAPEGKSGTAEIIARSGSAEEQKISINVGAAALSKLIITANPQSLPEGGGNSVITVIAFDNNMNLLRDVPIIIKSVKGTLLNGGIIQYTDNEGKVTDTINTNISTEISAESSYESNGTDNNEIIVSTEVIVTSKNALNASFIYSPKEPRVGNEIYFNASASTGGNGLIKSYEWDFGDGSTGSGEKLSHIYRRADDYVVQLVIINSVGSKDSMSVEINVKK